MYVCAVYSESAKESYKRGQRNLSEQPHVFAIAQEAYGDLTLNQSQSIVIRCDSCHVPLCIAGLRYLVVALVIGPDMYVCMYVCMYV